MRTSQLKPVAGKRVILVDDSVVRGTTSMKLKDMLLDAGASEVHYRIASPPTEWPCFYGVDTPERSKLLAATMTEEQMRSLGLYVSDPLSEAETNSRFAEPGTFAMQPDGTLMLVDISNGPASRPDLEELLDGMIFNIDSGRPVRGTA